MVRKQKSTKSNLVPQCIKPEPAIVKPKSLLEAVGAANAPLSRGLDLKAIDTISLPLGRMEIQVVGCQHYPGQLRAGEYAYLKREPWNAYDKNAVAVENTQAQKVGHLKREFARLLAPILDDPSPTAPRCEVMVLHNLINRCAPLPDGRRTSAQRGGSLGSRSPTAHTLARGGAGCGVWLAEVEERLAMVAGPQREAGRRGRSVGRATSPATQHTPCTPLPRPPATPADFSFFFLFFTLCFSRQPSHPPRRAQV